MANDHKIELDFVRFSPVLPQIKYELSKILNQIYSKKWIQAQKITDYILFVNLAGILTKMN